MFWVLKRTVSYIQSELDTCAKSVDSFAIRLNWLFNLVNNIPVTDYD